MDALRKLPFVIAVICIALVFCVELGSSVFTAATPGMAIPYLAFLDGLLLLTAFLMGSSLIIPERIHGRVQGLVQLLCSLAVLIFGFLAGLVAFVLLMVMVGLFLAAPFGTLAYLAIWGSFDRGGASATLALLMALKLGFGIALVIAQQRFLTNKGLVLLVLTSLLANVIIAFLHGFLPSILTSITDALSAIIVAVLAFLWALFMFLWSIPAVLKSIRLEKESA
jgi:hypothetical protein